jgi:DNA-binding MarR family transcriptional regulator
VLKLAEDKRGLKIIKIMKTVQHEHRHAMVKEFKELNLTAPQGMVVMILLKEESLKISELSEKMGLSNSTVSGIIDRLEKLNYVVRIRGEKDRRVVRVGLTETFREESKCRFTKGNHYFDKIMEFATEEEIEQVNKGLEVLEEIMKRAKKNQEEET